MTNIEIAQLISERIGPRPVPFESVRALCLQIYQELGGSENDEHFEDIYQILLEILPLASEVANVIDDTSIRTDKTWSSNKINSELEAKQDVLTAGDNITIENNVISATGGGGVADLMQEVTYSELKTLRDSSALVPGMNYRITDYVTKVGHNYEGAKSVEHQFDIIVTADSSIKLNEVAKAIHHNFDNSEPQTFYKWTLYYDDEHGYLTTERYYENEPAGMIEEEDIPYYSTAYNAAGKIDFNELDDFYRKAKKIIKTDGDDILLGDTYWGEYYGYGEVYTIDDEETCYFNGTLTIDESKYFPIETELHYYVDEGAYLWVESGTVTINGITYYKWERYNLFNDYHYGEFMLTTQSEYNNQVAGQDNAGYDFYLNAFDPAGTITYNELTFEPYDEHKIIYTDYYDVYDLESGEYINKKCLVLGDQLNPDDETTSIHRTVFEAWELKYCLDNDTNRFQWAETGREGLGFSAIKVSGTKISDSYTLVLGDEIDCVGDDWEGEGHYYIDEGAYKYTEIGTITDNGTTYYKWFNSEKNNTVLTTQEEYTNSVSGTNDNGCDYYDTVYNIVGEITIDDETFEDFYKDKHIIKSEREIQMGTFLYKRYPAGDNENGYAWAYVRNSFNTDVNSLGAEWGNINTNDIIYTESETPELNISVSEYTIEDYSANVGEIESGKGVIYYMKDEFNNVLNYDFKNIKYYVDDSWKFTFGGSIDDTLNGNSNNNYYVSDFDGVLTLYQHISDNSVKGLNITQGGGGTEYYPGDYINIDSQNRINCTYRYSYTLPTASSNTLGGVKVGSGLSITNGVLNISISGGDNIAVSDGVIDCNYTNVDKGITNNNGTLELDGDIYELLAKLVQDEYNSRQLNGKYLTFEATDDDTVITFRNYTYYGSAKQVEIECSKDLLTWKKISPASNQTVEMDTLNSGEILYVRGNNAAYSWEPRWNSNPTTFNIFGNNKLCYVYGNIMSLINKKGFDNLTSYTEDYVFPMLFSGATIEMNSSKHILMPSSNATRYCYYSMFKDCTSLTTAPELPATELADCCYQSMFQGCISLTSAPSVLPATTVRMQSYSSMFYNCTSLTSAPALPATTLALSCYSSMFYNCTSLTSAPTLPATSIVGACYAKMFENCTSLTSAPNLPATNLRNGYSSGGTGCYQNMFQGCTSLTTAPLLSATTLSRSCYRSMFENCTGMTTIPNGMLPATIVDIECYVAMFRGCTSLVNVPNNLLPATVPQQGCYKFMFQNCSSLTTAPDLPAIFNNNTNLGWWAYQEMFAGCTNLTTAPVLLSPSLRKECYNSMFKNCSSLAYIKCLATDISADGCTSNWLSGAAANGTFEKDASMSSWTTGASGIPSGWTVQDYVAPNA